MKIYLHLKKHAKLIKIFCLVIALAILVGAGVIFRICYVMNACTDAIYRSPDALPSMETALLLGTAQKTRNNTPNHYFRNRIAAAAQLYHAGKIKHILVSGDNSRADYNEPEDMKQALLEKGVPESAMTLDYAGFRTLDSIVRAKEVFQLENCLIITQQYHAVRALYIARKIDLQAIAFAAEDIEIKSVRQKNHLREKLARILAWFDMNILHTDPKFSK